MKPTLAFGGGPHICLGMHVARAEMTVGINTLLDRLPNLRLDPDAEPSRFVGMYERGATRSQSGSAKSRAAFIRNDGRTMTSTDPRDRPLADRAAVPDAKRRATDGDHCGGAPADRREGCELHDAGTHQGSRRRASETFYNHFAGKDQLLLAVLEDIVAEAAAAFPGAGTRVTGPIARLHFYITVPLSMLRTEDGNLGARSRTAEHWRLYQIFPDEVAQADQPFADLLDASSAKRPTPGCPHSADPARDALFAMHLVVSVYHHYAFATAHESLEDIAERLWMFCLAAFSGGR